MQEADRISRSFWSREDKILKCQWSNIRYISHQLRKFLFLPAIPHLPFTLSKPLVSNNFLVSKQETLTPHGATEAHLLCGYLTPLALQWHNPLKSVTLFLPRAVAVLGSTGGMPQVSHQTRSNTVLAVHETGKHREELQEEAHSENAALGTVLLWTAMSRGVSSHASKWHMCHPTCTCMGKWDSALLAKISCLRRAFDGEGNDLMGHLTWKKVWEWEQ